MKKSKNFLIASFVLSVIAIDVSAQKTITARFKETDDVLTNPGIGFTTFQRFNGDDLEEGIGWTEGFPIKYKKFDGNLVNKDYPMSSIAFFRVYWKYIEPEMGKYNWSMIDSALKTAHERHQALMLAIAPYGSGNKPNDRTDVPEWYRAMVGDRNEWLPTGAGWRVDAEDPRYALYFGKMITEFAKRYDGHPDFEAIDLSIIGFWGEGRGSDILKQQTREALVNAYTDNIKKTPLIALLVDEKTNKYAISQANVGWMVACIGDLDFVNERIGWGLMYRYPEWIINYGMRDAWKKAPVCLEICHVLKQWKEVRKYNINDVNYIIDETLKWHISSFNAKSSGVPEEWQPLIDRWLKKMGYRFVLRSFSYPEFLAPDEKLNFKSWWDNRGVAPIYKKFLLAVRLTNGKRSEVMITDADITTWLPGDNLYDDAVFIPRDMPAGIYQLQIGIVDRQTREPRVNLAIDGKDAEGWYSIGKIEIKGQ
jgi:hypothetical protein